jgi:hypothetical protein
MNQVSMATITDSVKDGSLAACVEAAGPLNYRCAVYNAIKALSRGKSLAQAIAGQA